MQSLADAGERGFSSQHLQRFKQRRGILSSADGYANRLKHLAGFHSQLLGGGAQSLIQWIMLELNLRQHFACACKNFLRHGCVSLLRDQFGRIIGWQLVDEEEVSGGEHVAQQLDALADERRDAQHLFGRDVEACVVHDRKQAGA